ncbi:MAG: hypothetical protein KGJ06_05445 [Pseudomonadota bacterium]|nr:hypothetical protein [Pseudomonadota bacterium]
MTPEQEEREGYIVEFITIGLSVKVTAIDPESLREVSIVGSPNASSEDLAQLAVRKLKYVLNRDKSE